MLLQRGHKRGPNATVRFDLAPVMAWVMGGQTAPLRPTAIREFDLGTEDGVPFSFTDGAALPDGAWLFSAVAEDNDSSYADGPCVATMIGSVNRDGALQATHRLLPTRKIEGIEARVLGDAIEISMVSDADDPGCPAEFGVARCRSGRERLSGIPSWAPSAGARGFRSACKRGSFR